MKTLAALCLMICAAFVVGAQKPEKNQVDNSFVPKIVARSGWTTPAFLAPIKSKLDRAPQILLEREVEVTQHFLEKQQLVHAESCDENIGATDTKNTFVIREFTTLSYKGRIFAYQLNYYGAFAENGTVTGYAGCLRRAIYVDENGDGKFTLQCGKETDVFLPLWMIESESQVLIVPRSGWTIPNFDGDIQTWKEDSKFIDDVYVDTKGYSFNQSKIISFEDCEAKTRKNSVENKPPKFIFNSFTSYAIKGRVFAYFLTSRELYPPPEVKKVYEVVGREAETGCSFSGGYLLYVDEDGDGTFERRCTSDLVSLPQWVKEIGEIKVKTAAKH